MLCLRRFQQPGIVLDCEVIHGAGVLSEKVANLMGVTVSTSCDVKRSGVYRCLNCDNQLRLEVGEEAPGCEHCNGMPVTWQFVRPLVGRIGFITS